MKILPINNTFNISKNHNYKPSFKAGWIDDTNSYDRMDSYIDESGLHYVNRRAQMPSYEPPKEDVFYNGPIPRNTKALKEKAFLTQAQYDVKTYLESDIKQHKERIQKLLYNLDIDSIESSVRYLDKYLKYNASKILSQPFFMLGLADIPLTDNNKNAYKNILDVLEKYIKTVNVSDKNGITLLEKIMNAENEPYLTTVRKACSRNGNYDYSNVIAYEHMQKYAFDNIQNPEFKKKCINLPIKFFDIIDDIERKDLLSLDRDIHEQMKCGFCDIEYAIRECLYYPARKIDTSDYPRIILNVAKKHFPNAIKAFAKMYL